VPIKQPRNWAAHQAARKMVHASQSPRPRPVAAAAAEASLSMDEEEEEDDDDEEDSDSDMWNGQRQSSSRRRTGSRGKGQGTDTHKKVVAKKDTRSWNRMGTLTGLTDEEIIARFVSSYSDRFFHGYYQ
jgi:hypothetical protein